jgi:transcriptional regulator with XRE-family HTH domain
MTKRPDEADIALGRRLKSLRVGRGLSQTALGLLLGVSFQQIQKYENATNRIRVSQLRRIAEALGVQVMELLEVSRAESSEVTDMIDTRTARRLMEAFRGLPSGERRCLAVLAEAMAERHEEGRGAGARLQRDRRRDSADDQHV